MRSAVANRRPSRARCGRDAAIHPPTSCARTARETLQNSSLRPEDFRIARTVVRAKFRKTPPAAGQPAGATWLPAETSVDAPQSAWRILQPFNRITPSDSKTPRRRRIAPHLQHVGGQRRRRSEQLVVPAHFVARQRPWVDGDFIELADKKPLD